MTEELARRAVACRHWRWMPAMRLQNGYMLKDEDFPTLGDEYGWLPNLTDPCTLGGLLALVREAYGKPGIHARRIGSSLWRVYDDAWLKKAPLGKGSTEAAALVAALEAAP